MNSKSFRFSMNHTCDTTTTTTTVTGTMKQKSTTSSSNSNNVKSVLLYQLGRYRRKSGGGTTISTSTKFYFLAIIILIVIGIIFGRENFHIKYLILNDEQVENKTIVVVSSTNVVVPFQVITDEELLNSYNTNLSDTTVVFDMMIPYEEEESVIVTITPFLETVINTTINETITSLVETRQPMNDSQLVENYNMIDIGGSLRTDIETNASAIMEEDEEVKNETTIFETVETTTSVMMEEEEVKNETTIFEREEGGSSMPPTSQTIIINDVDNVIENVEPFMNDLMYRQVCTSVGFSSILCLIVRYPFPVQLQQQQEDDNDEVVRYPKPVDNRFYNLSKTNVYTITKKDWVTDCVIANNTNPDNTNNDNNQLLLPIDDEIQIKTCLDNRAEESARRRRDKAEPVVALWTRRNPNKNMNRTLFHAIGHDAAVQRLFDFFGKDPHDVLIVGSSPAPHITRYLKWLLGNNCQLHSVYPLTNYDCIVDVTDKTVIQQHREQPSLSTSSVMLNNNKLKRRKYDKPNVKFQSTRFRPEAPSNGQHAEPNSTLLFSLHSTLQAMHRGTPSTSLKNITIIIDYPLQHVQSQDMVDNIEGMEMIYKLQSLMPENYMNLTSPNGHDIFHRHGYQLQNVIVFDGLPQFFPTKTSLYTARGYFNKTQQDVSKAEHWITDYGTSCRGPLPSNAVGKEILKLSRERFYHHDRHYRGQNQYDQNENRHGTTSTASTSSSPLLLQPQLHWYGRIWEFANLFWWQTFMWQYSGLDCTHSGGYDGFYGVHKFFVQAMIDDYLENR